MFFVSLWLDEERDGQELSKECTLEDDEETESSSEDKGDSEAKTDKNGKVEKFIVCLRDDHQ